MWENLQENGQEKLEEEENFVNFFHACLAHIKSPSEQQKNAPVHF